MSRAIDGFRRSYKIKTGGGENWRFSEYRQKSGGFDEKILATLITVSSPRTRQNKLVQVKPFLKGHLVWIS